MKLLISILVLVFFLSAPFTSVFASAKTMNQTAPFENSPAWAKLDLRFKNEWKQLIKDNGDEKLACFIKTSHDLSEDDKAILKSSGFDYQTVAGKILTGKVRVDRVPNVAGLDFIEVMELATPMTPKKHLPAPTPP